MNDTELLLNYAVTQCLYTYTIVRYESLFRIYIEASTVPIIRKEYVNILVDLFKKKGSGDVAKDRLKLLLVSDRANCSPEVMEMIKNDIIKVISKYMVIDAEGLDIQITSTESDTNNGSVPAIFANIPIKDMRNSEK